MIKKMSNREVKILNLLMLRQKIQARFSIWIILEASETRGNSKRKTQAKCMENCVQEKDIDENLWGHTYWECMYHLAELLYIDTHRQTWSTWVLTYNKMEEQFQEELEGAKVSSVHLHILEQMKSARAFLQGMIDFSQKFKNMSGMLKGVFRKSWWSHLSFLIVPE